MDKYDAINDHYCYPNTAVLKNKFNIVDMNRLEEKEREVTRNSMSKIRFKTSPYDLRYMCALHNQIFSELYDWAGEIRTVDITKGRTRFCNNNRIIPEANKLFDKLGRDNWLKNLPFDFFCEKAAYYYCEFNVLHPFREGNGRVQRALFDHIALNARYDFNWGMLSKNAWIAANEEGYYGSDEAMTRLFKQIVTCAR